MTTMPDIQHEPSFAELPEMRRQIMSFAAMLLEDTIPVREVPDRRSLDLFVSRPFQQQYTAIVLVRDKDSLSGGYILIQGRGCDSPMRATMALYDAICEIIGTWYPGLTQRRSGVVRLPITQGLLRGGS